MSEQNVINPIISWAAERPLWEKYIWKVCLEAGGLAPEHLDAAYNYLLIESGVVASEEPLPEISLDGLVPPDSNILLPIRIKSLSSVKNVNALDESQEITFHENLTLIYGGNGTGKSGYGRLFSKACFSRANKIILPNLTKDEAQGHAQATFTFHDGTPHTFVNNGVPIESLKRFSVFDSDCVPIYIDGANSLQFTPGQLTVFDKVNQYVHEIEVRFNDEKASKKIANPVPLIFQSEPTSPVSSFLSRISHLTGSEEIDANIGLKEEINAKLQELQKEKDELVKLDHSKKKKEIIEYTQYLNNFRTRIDGYLENFSGNRIQELNGIVKDVLEKKQLVSQLGFSKFDTGVLKTVGSEKWKALLIAAQELSEAEKNAGSNLDKCILCHQDLHESENTLFSEYWKFLASTAESDFKLAASKLQTEVKSLEILKTKLPVVNDESLPIKTLNNEDPETVQYIKNELSKVSDLADKLIESLKEAVELSMAVPPKIDWKRIDSIIAAKIKEEKNLEDPSDKINKIDSELLVLKHKEKAKASKAEIDSYLTYLIWENKANKISFPKNTYTVTRKRFFNEILTERYRETFNEEVAALDGHEDLTITTSGRDGETVIKLGLKNIKANKLKDVLSEGEQKVSALADFLTEVRVDRNNCGIIFDDPVTSLDHERKSLIARRLVLESQNRQVIIFTHDIVFMSMLVESASENDIKFSSHWIRKLIDGTLGVIEKDSNPKLSNLDSLKIDAKNSVNNYHDLGEKEKEKALGSAFDYLRSATEALVREVLLAGTMKRYEDHIRVQNIEEIPFTKEAGAKIVKLHGKISELGLMHDRSNEMREKLPDLEDFKKVYKEFEELEEKLKKGRKLARQEKEERKTELKKNSQGWQG